MHTKTDRWFTLPWFKRQREHALIMSKVKQIRDRVD